jgi:hypothetical protein
MSINISELSGRKGLDQNLFEQIGLLAKETGSLSTAQLEELANEFLIGKANTYGSASFYDFTREEELKLKDGIKNITLIAYNTLGQQAYLIELPTGRESYTVNVSSWIAGFYNIKIIGDEDLISAHKITIIK